ncbi:hypothetical protein EON80_22840 [bacterium]|nr:MAG: hypothetical protein EON80_22840 [bacterium]
MNTRITPLALSAFLLGGAFVQAHAAPQKPSNLQARTQTRMQSLLKVASGRFEDLGLSPAQKSKMGAIARKNKPLIQAVWSDNSLSQSQKASQVRKLEKEASAVLTPAQKQKLSAAKGEAMGKVFETAMWVSQELNLTGAQQNQLRNIVMDSYRKSSGGDFGALRGLIVDTSGKVDKVLTPAQRSKWVVIKTTARQELIRQTRAWRQMAKV